MSDLIRRLEDARIALEYISDSMDRYVALEAIKALPAVTVQAQIDAGWQPIETAPKDCIVDLWSIEGGRYPDAIWDACCGVEGWTDANDHRSLEGASFTHWRHRPAPPPIRKENQP